MNNKHCNDCGDLVQYNGRDCEDYNIDIDDNIICGECGIKSHCFCDDCGEYVSTSQCIMIDDIVHDVDGLSVDESKVICDICDAVGDELKNRYKDNK